MNFTLSLVCLFLILGIVGAAWFLAHIISTPTLYEELDLEVARHEKEAAHD